MSGTDILRILEPGYSSLQDQGRIGYRSYAIPTSGCLDYHSQQLANFLVGNEKGQAVIEIIGRFEAEVLATCHFGACGVKLSVAVNDTPAETSRTISCKKGDRISLKGQLVYLACPGGFNGLDHFESLATYPLAKLGGLDGSILKKSNILHSQKKDLKTAVNFPVDVQPKLSKIIRVIEGPEFSGDKREVEEIEWDVSSSSNRMGLRLTGQSLISDFPEMSSVPVFPGTIQLPPNGEPIVLLADCQTTGGYPRVAQVIKADLSRVGRYVSGGKFRLKFVTLAEARHINLQQESFVNYALSKG